MVYVLSLDGKPLMPSKRHGRVRHLLERGEAKVVRLTPFTIQLTYEAGHHTQPITLGVDAGSKAIGFSATTETEELYAAEAYPRNDVVSNLSTRREFRRARRNRTTRYRKPRFDNRVHSKHKGWLSPSVDVKINNHLQGIRFAMKLLPVTAIVIENAEFDVQAIKAMEEGKPLPQGADYQQGAMLGEYNIRQYVLYRDGYRCRKCGAKGKDVKFHCHHLESRKVGSDAPSNRIVLCESCHMKYHKGIITLDGIKKGRNYRDAAFMGIMRKTLFERVKAMFLGIEVRETKGFITKYVREKNAIPKSHVADARCISGHPAASPADEMFAIKPVRRHNRKLHKATIATGGYRKSNQAPKYVFGFRLFDKVICSNSEGFIFGRRSNGSFDVRTLNGTKISAGISYKKLILKEKCKNLLIERRKTQECWACHDSDQRFFPHPRFA